MDECKYAELSAHSHSASSDSLHSEGAGYGPSGGSSSGRGGKSGSGSRSGSSSRRYSKGSGSGSGSASESADHSVKPKSRTTALQARRVETNVRLVNDDDTKHHDSKEMEEDSDDDTKHHDSKDMEQDDISERLGLFDMDSPMHSICPRNPHSIYSHCITLTVLVQAVSGTKRAARVDVIWRR